MATDPHSIDLEPEKVHDPFRYATLLRRLGALAIDVLLLFIPLMIIFMTIDPDWEFTLSLALVILLSLNLLYHTAFIKLYGRTIGKKVCGLYVLDHVSEQRLGWGQSIIRNFFIFLGVITSIAALVLSQLFPSALAFLDSLPVSQWPSFWWPVNGIFAWLHPDKRAIHDMMAGSVVIRASHLHLNKI